MRRIKKKKRKKKKTVKLVLFQTKEKQPSDWSVATLCAHAQLIGIYVRCHAVTGMCCSSQPEPALTDQSRHRERCKSRSRARRTVLATFGKLLRFFQKSLDLSLGFKKKKKVAKGVCKVARSRLFFFFFSNGWSHRCGLRFFFSRTLEKLGRTCEQIGRTLEPCFYKSCFWINQKVWVLFL